MSQIEIFKDGQVLVWRKEVEETAYENLKQPLLKRVPKNNTLMVNFDPQLFRMLREVKYFYQLNMPIPDCAADIYSKDQ